VIAEAGAGIAEAGAVSAEAGAVSAEAGAVSAEAGSVQAVTTQAWARAYIESKSLQHKLRVNGQRLREGLLSGLTTSA
jgi:hypothetical protein